MRAAGERGHVRRPHGLIAILWRSRLRVQEALALAEGDLDPHRGSLLVRRGKRGRRRGVGMDAHQLRRAHAIEMAREGVLLIVIQRQLGHRNLGLRPSTSKASTAAK